MSNYTHPEQEIVDDSTISYKHKDDVANKTRYFQRACAKLPQWAADVRPYNVAQDGEYYADYDEESGCYCVFHTDRHDGQALNSYSKVQGAVGKAEQLNNITIRGDEVPANWTT